MEDNQGTKVPGEGEEGTSLSPQIVEQARIEKARKKGWKPLEEFDGDPADWVEAKEFLGREPLFEANRDLKKQIRQQQVKFNQDMRVISQQFAQMNEQAYKRALTDLREQRDIAIIDKDIGAVRELDTKIDETKRAHIQAVQTTQVQRPEGETDYMREWRGNNTWFDSDQTLQDEAVSIGVGYMIKNQGTSQEKMLEYVTDRIKKIYPEKFLTKKTQRMEQTVENEEEGAAKGAGNTVERSTHPLGNRGGKRVTLTVNDLSDIERSVMQTFIKRGVLKDLAEKNKRSEQAEYLAQLAERRGV